MTGEQRVGYLQESTQERFNTRRAWFVRAWRVVDAKGVDIVQPWMPTKAEARRVCRELNIQLIECKT